MKYKDYSSDIWKHIKATTEAVLKNDPQPVAAFDADGTLWDTDLGETFFHYLIDNKLVELPENAFSYYEEMKKENAPKAYLWLAQICKAQKIETIYDWARKAVTAHHPLPLFQEQKKLIDYFLSKGIRVYIITASVKWAVEPGAEIIGLNKNSVLGVQTKVQNGLISTEQEGPITYRSGKVEALLQATNGKSAFFASGNTMGDFDLLTSATHLRLAVSAASRDDRIFRTENDLKDQALVNQWMYHRFIQDSDNEEI